MKIVYSIFMNISQARILYHPPMKHWFSLNRRVQYSRSANWNWKSTILNKKTRQLLLLLRKTRKKRLFFLFSLSRFVFFPPLGYHTPHELSRHAPTARFFIDSRGRLPKKSCWVPFTCPSFLPFHLTFFFSLYRWLFSFRWIFFAFKGEPKCSCRSAGELFCRVKLKFIDTSTRFYRAS